MCDLYFSFLILILFCCNLFSVVSGFAQCMAACRIIKFVDFALLDFFFPWGKGFFSVTLLFSVSLSPERWCWGQLVVSETGRYHILPQIGWNWTFLKDSDIHLL